MKQEIAQPTEAYLENEVDKLRGRHFVHEVGAGGDGSFVEYSRNADGVITGQRPYDARIYSRMKYGDPRAVDLAARELFTLLTTDSELSEALRSRQVAVTNSAREVPTASFQIMHRLVGSFLNPYLAKAGLGLITQVRSEQAGNIADSDYGRLDLDGRRARMAERKTFFGPEATSGLQGKCVVLFDDLVCTGTYEANQVRLLESVGVAKADILKLYWIQIEPTAGQDPSFEAALNHAAVKSLIDILPFFAEPEFEVTERLIKFILAVGNEQGRLVPTKEVELRDFLDQIPERDTLWKLFRAVNSRDGFAQMERLRPGAIILAEKMSRLGMIEPV